MFTDIFNTEKRYEIIYADPPWKYKDSSCEGACEKHYSTMSVSEMCKLPINKIASKDCALFIWATYPKLPEVLKLIEMWGFSYKSIAFQWVKQNKSGNGFFFGLGRWTRGNTEPCLIATKGKPKRVSASVGQLVISPLTRHSAKPPEVREKIVNLMGDGPEKIELFARDHTVGWDCWGNEVTENKTKEE